MVLSGPSGAGKDSILAGLRRRGYRFHLAVTATTRPPRPGEEDGRDYHFVSPQAFREMLNRGALLEHAEVYGQQYGVPKIEVKEGLEGGVDTFLRVDVQGAATLRRLLPGAVLIFIAPGSVAELKGRLKEHLSPGDESFPERWARFPQEMGELANFDYLVVNRESRLEEAVEEVLAIVTAEKCRAVPRRVAL